MDSKDQLVVQGDGLNRQMIISVIYLFFYFAILYFQQKGTLNIDDMTMGVLTALVPAIIHFWVGSSHGSKVK